VRLAYATIGDGPPLVKAANWLSHLDYDWQSPVWRHWLVELSRRFRLVRYDERGCGLYRQIFVARFLPDASQQEWRDFTSFSGGRPRPRTRGGSSTSSPISTSVSPSRNAQLIASGWPTAIGSCCYPDTASSTMQ